MVEDSGAKSNFLAKLNEAAKWFNSIMDHANEDWRNYKISYAKKRLKQQS